MLLRLTISPQTCKGQFCPAHRFPTGHTCVSASSSAASTPSKSAGLSPAGFAALKRATASSAPSSKQSPAPTTSRQNASTSQAPKRNNKPINGLIQEIKTDRCEPSSSSVFPQKPTIPSTNNLTQKLDTLAINNVMNTRSTPPPTNRPRNAIPDPTKKWVPASVFASA